MKDAYIAMWRTNGNVALIWHALMIAAVIIIACRVWIALRERRYFNLRTRNSRPADEVFENFERQTFYENTDRHDY